jgi:formamidopyrimidine-DNA glycosylase
MPELPEVEACRHHLEESCLHGVIIDVKIKEAGGGPRQGLFDDIVFELSHSDDHTVSQQSYIDSLLHRKLEGVHRKGKQLWLSFDAAVDARLPRSSKRYEAVLFHFGMTGSLVVKDAFIPVYKSFDISSDQWPPRFTKLELVVEKASGEKVHVSFADPRRLGRICLRDNPISCPPISRLGIDLTRDPSYDLASIVSTITGSARPIKVILLDQEKVFCGVGNWIGKFYLTM